MAALHAEAHSEAHAEAEALLREALEALEGVNSPTEGVNSPAEGVNSPAEVVNSPAPAKPYFSAAASLLNDLAVVLASAGR
eukprot:1180541-Prorocentrum_minimum.AAC.1